MRANHGERALGESNHELVPNPSPYNRSMRGALFALVSVLLLPQDGIRTGISKSGHLVGRTEALSRYDLPPGPFEWKLTPRTDPPEERAFDLTFPSAVKGEIEENNTVWCRVWMPKE